MKSWKTTILGIIAAIQPLYALVMECVQGSCDWSQMLVYIMAIAGVFGLGVAARDNNVTSEEAKA